MNLTERYIIKRELNEIGTNVSILNEDIYYTILNFKNHGYDVEGKNNCSIEERLLYNIIANCETAEDIRKNLKRYIND